MLFLWGVTMVLGDSLQTQQEAARQTCIPQSEGAPCCVTWSLFSGGLFKTKLFHSPLSFNKGAERAKQCIKNNFDALSFQRSYLWCEKDLFPSPAPLSWYFWRMLQSFLPQFMVRVNASLQFRTMAATVSGLQQSTPVLKTEWDDRRQGGLAAEKGLFSPTTPLVNERSTWKQSCEDIWV